MNQLATTEEKTGMGFVEVGLLDRAAQLNKLSEVSQVALGMVLVKIKDEKLFEPDFKDFKEYYQNALGRSKGDISRLLTVGRKLLDGGFLEEPVPNDLSYTQFYAATLAFPDQPVEYLVAAAQTNTMAELSENSRDQRTGPDHTHSWEGAFHCTDEACGKYTLHV